MPTKESQHFTLEEEYTTKKIKIDVFKVKFKKIRNFDNSFQVIYNNYIHNFKFKESGGLVAFKKHVEKKHPT